ncbi:glycoside hydrolase family 3 N-terminal domain-containing protein [Amycolatopsis sp. VC5-11]|uniref:glycoside hydrolase family 3 N-terminal domain-containing protein n=1 Tax=Amycolatopsis sp. VC5-11 TaxID=3120156 RepID=UPI00300AA5F1
MQTEDTAPSPRTPKDGAAPAGRRTEARAVGIHWTFAPMTEIAPHARWGRMVEGTGEGPALGARPSPPHRGAASSTTPKPRESSPSQALPRHGASRGGRDYDEGNLSDAHLWNVCLAPFRAAVQAGAANVMSDWATA